MRIPQARILTTLGLGVAVASLVSPATAQVGPSTQIRNQNFDLRLATPSPSPAPLAAPVTALRVQTFTAASKSGAKLTTLKNLPVTSIIVVGGKPVELRDLQAKVRTITLAHLGPPKMYTRDGEIHGVFGDLNKDKFKGSTSLNRLAGKDLSLADQRSKIATFRAPAQSILDPSYCKTNPPYVTSVKGSVTPGGYIVVEGGCFGTAGGEIKLIGKFDGGALVLQSQNWDAGSITASIPKVTGVYDQKVPLQITTSANAASLAGATMLSFVATRESLPLPGHYVTATTCDQTYIQAQCVDGTGFRLELGSPFGGTDMWHAQAPAGWVLTSLTWSGAIGTVDYGGGFENGGPSDASWPMTWKTGIARTVTQTQTILGVTVSSDTTDFYGSTYGMTVYAEGPAGTMPS